MSEHDGHEDSGKNRQQRSEKPEISEELITFGPDDDLAVGPMYIISHGSALTLRRRLCQLDVNGEPGTNRAGAFLSATPRFTGLGTAVCPGAKTQPDELIRLLEAGLLDNPIDLLVPGSKDRRRTTKRERAAAYRPHVWAGAVPPQSFEEVVFSDELAAGVPLYPEEGPSTKRGGEIPNVLCSTEPMIFAQLARSGDEVALAELACELCGEYALAPQTDAGFVKHGQGLTREELLAYVEALGWDSYHHREGYRAAKMAATGAKSPLETTVYLLLCLPARLGGYGIPRALLNPWLDADCNVVAGKESKGDLRPDLYWPKARIDVEVHGFDFHVSEKAGTEKRMDDIDRELRLKDRGVDVRTLTIRQIRDVEAMDELARHILQKLWMSRRMPSGPQWEKRRDSLRSRIIPAPRL